MSPIQPAFNAVVVVAISSKSELRDLEYWSRAIGAGRGGVICVAVATAPEVRASDLLLAGATGVVRFNCAELDGAAVRMAAVKEALGIASGFDPNKEIPWAVCFVNAWERPVYLDGEPGEKFPPGWLWSHMADGVSMDPSGAWRVTVQHLRPEGSVTTDPVRIVELTPQTKVAGVGTMHVRAPKPSVQRMAGFQLVDSRHKRETEEQEAARIELSGAYAKRSVLSDPDDADAWVELAAWREWANDDKGAADALEMALSIEPALTEARLLLGVVRLRHGYETLAAAVRTVPADHSLSAGWLEFLRGFNIVRVNTQPKRRPHEQATK